MHKNYHTIGLGGTFDHFHIGHQRLLDFAAAQAEGLEIGVTTEQFLQSHPKAFAHTIENFVQRQHSLEKYLIKNNIAFHIYPLEDVYGLTTDPDDPYRIDAVALTAETKRGGELINERRNVLGINALPLLICHVLQDDHGLTISSNRIRSGEINRSGITYSNILLQDVKINDVQKHEMREKQGKLINRPSENFSPLVCVVGDIVLETFVKNRWAYDVGIFDGRSEQRGYSSPFLSGLAKTRKVKNEAGSISQAMTQSLKEIINQVLKNDKYKGDVVYHVSEAKSGTSQFSLSEHLFVHGEEDLAAVALVFILPLEAKIYYGQPGEGMVEMIVTEELKEKFRLLFS